MSEPQRYRKKPVIIEAMRWDGSREGGVAIAAWAESYGHRASYWSEGDESGIDIYTLEGRMTAAPGDHVIRGVAGEFYPVKPSIFHETYEAVES